MELTKKKAWTVFFLVKSVDQETMKFLIGMLKTLTGVAFGEEIAVVFCINFKKSHMEALMSLDEELVTEASGNDYTTRFFRFIPARSGSGNTLDPLGEEYQFNVTEETDLYKFFREKIVMTYSAHRYLLFTWDHGNGFGIFGGAPQDQREVKVITSDTPVPVLTMDELALALSWSFGQTKINVIVMMNCLMQVTDTAYALRNQAKYLIAPESLMDFGAYDYNAIFSHLAANPCINSRKLSSFIVNSFKKNTDPDRYSFYRVLSGLSISACRLKFVDELVITLDMLARKWLERLPEILARSGGNPFLDARLVDESSKLYDLYSLLIRLSAIANKEEQVLIQHLLMIRSKLLHRTYKGRLFNLPEQGPLHKTQYGISVSLKTPGQSEGGVTSFQSQTAWGHFVAALNNRRASSG